MLRRIIPKSIERQLFEKKEPKKHKSQARFVECIIGDNRVKINARCLPDDLPSIEYWLRTRFIKERLNENSLSD